MPLTTTTTPAVIAVALGQPAPASGSTEHLQWKQWIDDALWLIQRRVDSIDPEPTVDQKTLDYVIRLAVEARTERPKGGSGQVTTSIDDGSVSRTYRGSRRTPDVDIEAEWWEMLGLSKRSGQAFNVDLMPPGAGIGGDRATYWWLT